MRSDVNRLVLDAQSSTEGQPHAIMINTSDCTEPKEIDDGVAVDVLDADSEMYRVSVCVADTSRLYGDRDVLRQVMARTEAKYFMLPNRKQGYEPMIDEEIIREIEFSAGNTRSAMIIQFVVGENQPPTDVNVKFGQVEVAANYNYRDFWLQTQAVEGFDKYARASGFIVEHMGFNIWRDNDEPGRSEEPNKLPVEPTIEDLIRGEWRAGAQLNEAFMVGAGGLVGMMIDQENGLGIWRVHDPSDLSNMMFLPPHLARYSWEPAPHHGIGLRRFMRVTSPMRRAEDFVECGLLKKRDKGLPITPYDVDVVAGTVQQLNSRVAADYMRKSQPLSNRNTLGAHRRQIARSLLNYGNVVPLREDTPGEAIA